jgi:ABC-2 type transport system permease protein
MLPIGFGPPIIQTLSRLDPFFYAVNAARNLINGALTSSSIPQAFAVFVILACLSLALFIHSMREAVA